MHCLTASKAPFLLASSHSLHCTVTNTLSSLALFISSTLWKTDPLLRFNSLALNAMLGVILVDYSNVFSCSWHISCSCSISAVFQEFWRCICSKRFSMSNLCMMPLIQHPFFFLLQFWMIKVIAVKWPPSYVLNCKSFDLASVDKTNNVFSFQFTW